MYRLLTLWLCVSLVVFGHSTGGARAAANVQFERNEVTYTFGGQAAFHVYVQAGLAVQSVQAFYRYEGIPETYPAEAEFSEDGKISFLLDARAAAIPAFAEVDYWFFVTLEDGSTATSPTYTFEYFDNRFNWQTPLEALPLRVHWYSSDPAYGQILVDIAHQGLDKINRLIGVLPSQAIDVYVYENALDMQSTLRIASVKWIAGHADPWLNVVVVSLPPGPDQLMLARQRIPHELMHILLYQHLAEGYENLPTWLNEGLASMAELQNNPDYVTILQKAHEQSLYLPISGLCKGFPLEASNAFLSYAEAELFTRYLYEQYGAAKMQALIAAYADGLACERAPELVFGKSLAQLESGWQEMLFGQDILAAGLSDVWPWLALLVVVLVTPVVSILIYPVKRGRKQ
ncbi:MAG: peptidase MA family metallohydrolase [Chloroflexota bacterium]